MINFRQLTPQEEEAVQLILLPDYHKIVVTRNTNGIERVEKETIITATEEEAAALVKNPQYHDVHVVRRDGKILYVRGTVIHRLS